MFLKEFLKKKSAVDKSMKNYPACQEKSTEESVQEQCARITYCVDLIEKLLKATLAHQSQLLLSAPRLLR